MRLRSIHFKDLLSIILLLFLMSSTTAYASIDGNVSYMESAQNISIFRFLSIATTVIALIAMWFMKQALVSRRSLVVGCWRTIDRFRLVTCCHVVCKLHGYWYGLDIIIRSTAGL